MTENLITRISFYLASGGLFNPELADHIAVRTLLFECREALAQRTWVGLTEAQCGVLWKTNMTPFEYYQAIESKLKEQEHMTPELDKAFDEEYAKYKALFPKEYDGKALARMQDRNDTLEEVAQEFDKMTSLGDTAASFAVYVRNMKR